jgi:hypothetical protein
MEYITTFSLKVIGDITGCELDIIGGGSTAASYNNNLDTSFFSFVMFWSNQEGNADIGLSLSGLYRKSYLLH